MGATRVISVVGKKNAGKTTLVVALAAEFVRQRRAVATIKHGHHPALVDVEGTDTWRHYHEGMARRVMIESPGQRVLFERTEADGDPEALARQYMKDMDLVLVEGFKQSGLPKIEVHRKSQHRTPLWDAERDERDLWVAMVTDDESLSVPFPLLHFSDTSWLVALASIAWDRAKLLGA